MANEGYHEPVEELSDGRRDPYFSKELKERLFTTGSIAHHHDDDEH